MILKTYSKLRACLNPIVEGQNPVPYTMTNRPCIYLFSFAEDTRFKIGCTGNLWQRMRDHTTLAPDFTLVAVIYFDTMNQAEIAEQHALKWYDDMAIKCHRIGKSEVFKKSTTAHISLYFFRRYATFNNVEQVLKPIHLHNLESITFPIG